MSGSQDTARPATARRPGRACSGRRAEGSTSPSSTPTRRSSSARWASTSGRGCARARPCSLVATPAHARAVTRHLEDQGFGVADCTRRGQLIVLDAQETLACAAGRRSAGSRPLPGGDRRRGRGRARPRAAGGSAPSARWWTSSAGRASRPRSGSRRCGPSCWRRSGIALLCGYSIDAFDPGQLRRAPAARDVGALAPRARRGLRAARACGGVRLRWRCSAPSGTRRSSAARSSRTTRGRRRCPTPRRRSWPRTSSCREGGRRAARSGAPPLPTPSPRGLSRSGRARRPARQVRRPSGPRSSLRSSGVRPNRRASSRIACSSRSSASPTASISAGVRRALVEPPDRLTLEELAQEIDERQHQLRHRPLHVVGVRVPAGGPAARPPAVAARSAARGAPSRVTVFTVI